MSFVGSLAVLWMDCLFVSRWNDAGSNTREGVYRDGGEKKKKKKQMRKEQLNCKSHQFNCSLRAYSALYNTTTGDMSGHNNIECVTWCVSNWNKEKSPRKSESSALGEVISTAPESSVMGDMSADPCFLRDLDVYKYSIWLWTDNKSINIFAVTWADWCSAGVSLYRALDSTVNRNQGAEATGCPKSAMYANTLRGKVHFSQKLSFFYFTKEH